MRAINATKLLLIFLLFLALTACRRGEETPTPTLAPTAAVATSAPATSPTPAPAGATATPEPTAAPDLSAVDPADIDWPPQIVYSSPQPGEEALLDGAITIRFDQPMDEASVEAAFFIQPSGPVTATVDTTPVDGQFEWPRPDTLIFTPNAKLQRQQLYQVRIDPSATGRNGQALPGQVDLQFNTVGYLDVAQVIPSDGANGVVTDATITVMFNRPVVPLVVTGQQSGLPQPLQFDPPVEGQGEWTATSMYRFTPAEPLAGATEYTVTIPAGLTDITGALLENEYVWRFSTVAPSVAEIIPGTGSTDVVPTEPLTVTFNMPMDQASVESALSLDPAGRISYQWSADGRTVTLVPADRLELGTRYTLTVGSSARAATGLTTLDRETTSSFTTVPLPAVISTSPSDGQTADYYYYGVNIEFSAPMNPDTIEDRIQISPEPARINYILSDGGRYTYLDFPLQRNTDYVVTIPGDVADPYGNTLGRDYTFRFTTAGYTPLVSLNLPDRIAQLSSSYPSDVTIVYRNVSQVDALLYDVGLPLNLLRDPWQVQDYAPAVPPVQSWSLPVSTSQEEAGTLSLPLADGGTLPLGVYFLRLASPDVSPDAIWWQNQRAILVVADTNIVVKEMPDEVHVWVTDLATGLPAPGRDLTLYNSSGAQIGTGTSNSSGFASFDYQPLETYLSGVTVVSNAPGRAGFGVASSQWNNGVSPYEFGVNSDTSQQLPEFAYLYTDRPIYRPGDTVYYKGIIRNNNYARFSLPGRESVTLRVEQYNYYDSSQTLDYEETLPIDEFGTFNGQFTIPEDTVLGTYNLYLASQTNVENAGRTFLVAEYRKPEFQVTVTPDKSEVLRGETVAVTVEARYFFGAPAAGLPVNWTVYQQPYVLPWEGDYFSFTDNEDFFYTYQYNYTGYYGESFLSGSGTTDGQGKLVVQLPAGLLDDIDAGSRQVTLEAQVQDLSNLPVAARAAVVMHDATTYVGIMPADYLGMAGQDTAVDLITVGWDRAPVPNSQVEVVFYERTYEYSRERIYGYYQSVYTPIDTEVDRVTTTTDGQGEAQVLFVPDVGGTYRAVATVTDPAGRTQTSSTYLWVADENYVPWRTDPRERRMDLTPDKPNYNVGDTARILVQSPFEGEVQAWVTIERGNLLDQELVTLTGNSDTVEIPITPDLAPNAFVTIVVVKGVDETNRYADIRMGVVELQVSPERLLLNLSLTPQTDVLQPGDTVSYEIRATDYAGNPVQASVSLALVDLAVLTLADDNAPPIGETFYARQPYRSQTGSGLFISGEGLEVEIPEESGGYGGGGGGEGALDSGRALEEDEDVRRDFPDTAFWEASLITGADGTATVDIPLPDSVTTWRLSSKAVTADTLVGQTSVDVVATLPLLLRPVTPRFFTVGDTLQIGTVVNNNTAAALEVNVSLEAVGLTLQGAAEQAVTVPAGGQQLVRWPVTVDDVTFVDLTFRAAGGDYRDATKPTFGFGPDQILPVYRYDAEDLVGTSGVLDEAGQQVEAILLPENLDTRRGTVEVRVNGSLAGAIFETLDAVETGDLTLACAHGVVNALLPNASTALALRELDRPDEGLEARLDALILPAINRLAQLQQANGGWGFCASNEADPYLTAYVLYGLALADRAGYDVSAVKIDRALATLDIVPPTRISSRYAVNRQAFFLYVLATWQRADVADLNALVADQRELLDPYARAYLALAYDLAGQPDNDNVANLLSDLNSLAIVSATGAHWEDATPDVRNLSSDIRGTAVVISALANLDPENPLAASAVRWLMSSRTASVWTTPFETAWSVVALTDWATATGELQADYAYMLGVNGVALESGQFTADNLTETTALSVALSRLPADDISFFTYERGAGPGRMYYTTHLDAYLRAETVGAVSRGITVARTYFDAACDPTTETCEPITQIAAGQQVRVVLTVVAPTDLVYVVVEDPIPAGAEALNPNLNITGADFAAGVERTGEDVPYGYWGWWFFNQIQFRDEKVVFSSNYLPAGTYQYTYFLQTSIPGEFQVMPATARQEFFPEVFGRSEGLLFTIAE